MMQWIIILLLGLMLISLFTSLWFIFKGKNHEKASLLALTARILLAVSAFIFVLIAIMMGWVQPHGIG